MKTLWTKHSEKKLRFYNLSKNRILRIIKKPFRIEEGIAPRTIALMQPAKILKKGAKTNLETGNLDNGTKNQKKV